jgi:hypothetical protein
MKKMDNEIENNGFDSNGYSCVDECFDIKKSYIDGRAYISDDGLDKAGIHYDTGEEFPVLKVKISGRNIKEENKLKYDTVVECIKRGWSIRLTQKITGVSHHAILKYREKYELLNKDCVLRCGCGKSLWHKGGCGFSKAENISDTGDSIGRPQDRSDDIVRWHGDGISINRMASYFRVDGSVISKILKSAGVEVKKCPLNFKSKYGYSDVPHGIYDIWYSMIDRCYSKKNKYYEHYGGRGIKVCKEWISSATQFYSDMGDRPENKTIDRIDVNGNYEAGNCRWADKEIQQHNRTKYGKTSLYKGVYRLGNGYMAELSFKFKRHRKYFKNEIDAANEYDNLAVTFYGNSAMTNKKLGLI